jgi:RNA recognition motif-containing protein
MAKEEPEQIVSEEEKVDASSKKRKSALDGIQVDLSLPEPPSKKARRALKKGKTLPVKPTSDDEEDDEEGKADGAKDSKKKKERSPYGVWIGNLRFTVTKPELRKWLVDNSGGSITEESITRIHMPTTKPTAGPGPKKAPENRGFAYVDFATFDANVAAIALSETEWYRRKLLIKDSKSFEGRPKKEEPAAVAADGTTSKGAGTGDAKAAPGASTKIFVGNMSFNTTEDDLYAHFEKCGKIRWIKVATFEDSGKCKGYGWVNFEDAEAAAWAVKGFVKVRETVETLEDFMDVDEEDTKPSGDGEAEVETAETNGETKPSNDDNDEKSSGDSDDDSDSDSSDSSPKKKKKPQKPTPTTKEPARVRTRKWWVNQLLGRNLKIELAEDDQTRYHKRFGKGATAARRQQEQQSDNHHKPTQGPGRRNRDSNGNGEGGGGKEQQQQQQQQQQKAIKVQSDVSVARLTGAPVAHQGKKVTFD